MRMPARVLLSVLVVLMAAVAPPATARPAADPAPTSILVPIIADAPPYRAGDRILARGIIKSGSAALPGVAVDLQMRPYGAPAYSVVGTAVSTATGELELTTPALTHNTAFRWVYAGNSEHAPASADFSERISSRATIRVSDRTPATGQRVVVRGTTLPNKAGNRVSLWRGTKPYLGFGPVTHQTRLVRGHVRADGSYRLVVRFPTEGARRLFVQVGSGGGNVTGLSRYRRVTVH